ncbi:hypothetical protein D3C71_1390480 [compost metagenome]
MVRPGDQRVRSGGPPGGAAVERPVVLGGSRRHRGKRRELATGDTVGMQFIQPGSQLFGHAP